MEPRRILVREANWLGDVVMSLPALRAVRRGFPAASLALLVKKELASFFDGFDWIDEVIPFDAGRGVAGLGTLLAVVKRLRAGRFDTAIVLPRSFASALWVALAGVPRRIGFTDDARGWLLTDRLRRSPEILGTHQVHEYLALVRATLEIEGNPGEYRPDLDRGHRERMQGWLASRRRRAGPRLAVAVAAAHGPAKEWPAERYALLIDLVAERHGAECVLVGAPGERGRAEEVASRSRHGALVAAGETNVGELLALLSLCDGFAGNDSGAMHAAGALGVPTVGIFGSTRPERTSPLGPRTRVLYHAVPCSPCMARTCRYGHYDCLQRIAVEEVALALEDLGAFR
jgi:heptosyltransferase-2